MKYLIKRRCILFAAIIYCTSSLAAELPTKDSLKNSLNNKITSKISQSSSAASEKIETFITGNFENVKYLDFEIQVREKLKPSFNIMSVTELLKIDSGTIYNQTSITTHDDDETVNIGLGIRKLLNDNKVLIGSNIFYDQQFTNNHKRTGAGVEAISSVFDIRGNYYNAISGSKNTTDGSERALDGWDTQIDYHLPGEHDVNFFINAFKFENPDKISTYEEKGNKYGANAKLGHFLMEAGYMDDNQGGDSYFGSIKFVVNIGEQKENKTRNFLEYTDVSDKLYQPVKRENKIRVVKISSSNVAASGY
jgi:adhesin/invasin